MPLGGPVDFYSPEVRNEEVHLLDFWPEPGTYNVRLECVGKNPRSEEHFLGIESVRLRERRPRVQEYTRDRDAEWRAHPHVYR